jgi:drug/metabolite transporter (DMT)-like permease
VQATRARIVLAFAAVYLIWGSTYLAIKLAVETMPALLMAGTRFIVAGAALWMIVPGDRGLRPTRKDWGWAFVLGGLMLLGGNGLLSIAESKMPSGIAALLITSVPLWMVLVDWALGGGRPKALAVAGILIGFGGVALLAGENGGWEGGKADPLYVGMVLVGSFAWAVGSILARKGGIKLPILRAVALQMMAGGILLVVVGTLRGEWATFDPESISNASLAAWLYLIVLGAVVAYTAYGWLLTVQPPSVVSTYAFVNPIVAVALGWLVLQEPVGPRTLLAAPLIVGAVALVIYSKARTDRQKAAATSAEALAPAK